MAELMQCPCGGSTTERKATCRGTRLHYEFCAGCGRCGQWALIRESHLLAIGEAAQERFDALTVHRPSKPPAEDELAGIEIDSLEDLL